MIKRIATIIIIILTFSILGYSQNRKITYVSDDNSSGYLQVHVMDENGDNKRQVSDMSTDCYFPKWSPDGTKIVFYTEDGRIFYIDKADTENPDDPYYIFGGEHPSYSNDGEWVIFNSDYEGVLTIYAMQPSDDEPLIVSVIGYSNQQKLSQDGSKIVFSSFYEGSKKVMLIDLEDTTDNNLYQISSNEDANLLPDISSDNMMITWSRFNNNLQGTVYLYKEGDETALTKGIESSNAPKFSPDDSKIAFLSISGTSVKLYTMNIDGSERKQHSIKGGNVGNYIWIDDEHILYDAEDGTRYQIGIININSEKSEILTGGSSGMHPDIN